MSLFRIGNFMSEHKNIYDPKLIGSVLRHSYIMLQEEGREKKIDI